MANNMTKRRRTKSRFSVPKQTSNLPQVSSPLDIEAKFTPSTQTTNSRRKLRSKELCLLCKRKEVGFVCCCRFPCVEMCEKCVPAHLEEPPYGVHMALPMVVKGWIKSKNSVDSLRRRQLGKEQAKRLLMANLDRVEEAEICIRMQCGDIIKAVQETMRATLRELSNIKETLSQLIQSVFAELDAHSFDENYLPENRLTSAVWNFQDVRLEPELHLFSYCIDSQAVFIQLKHLVQFNVVSEMCEDSQKFIPIINSTALRKFYFSSERIYPSVPLSSPIKIDATSSWVFLDTSRLFACGRLHPPSKEAYVIHTMSGTVEAVENMTSHRSRQGMVFYSGKVYLFGGLSETQLVTCELFDCSCCHWRPLPSLSSPRDSFNPCYFLSLIYISGGNGACSIELFQTQTETFTQLFISLPKSGRAVSIIDGGELIVLQKDAVYRWKLNSTEEFREEQFSGRGTWSNCTPVVFEKTLYFLNCCSNAIGKCELGEMNFKRASFAY